MIIFKCVIWFDVAIAYIPEPTTDIKYVSAFLND